MDNNKKMAKNKLENISIEYIDECIFRLIALSPSQKSMEFRIKNNHIDWHKCRFSCPVYEKDGCCDNYSALSNINLIMMVGV
jgi:hypothetical protein